MKKNILWGELSWLLGPKIILPLLLTVALLTVALKIGDVGQVIPRMRTMPLWIICFALVMAATYLFLKGLQLHLLLDNLGAHPNTKHFLLAYSIGELAVTLPLGVFLQNWVLSVTGSAHFGRSSAATIMMLLLETAAVLLYLAVTGIPRWPEVRPVAVLVLIGMALVVFILLKFENLIIDWTHKINRPWLVRTLTETIGMMSGLRRLTNPRVLVVNLVIAGLYLAALSAAFYWVGNSLDEVHISYLDATTIYAFSLAVILIFGGIVSQLGTMEILGMTAAKAWGIDFTDGLALMLGFRLVWTGSIWLLNLPIVLALWHTLRKPEYPQDK